MGRDAGLVIVSEGRYTTLGFISPLDLMNGPSWSTGKYGTSLSFDGSNDAGVASAYSSALNLLGGSFTLSAWINPSSNSTWQIIVDKPYNTGHSSPYFDWSMHRQITSGKLVGFLGCDQVQRTSNSAIPLNIWTHVAVTYDGTSLRHYINGVLDRTAGVSCTVTNTNSRPIRVGTNGAGGEVMNGLIDDVRIYNRPLSAAEIATDMNTPLNGSGSDTQAPTIPSGLSATAASSTQVNLSWTASTDNVAVTGYLVERCQGAGCSTFAQIATPTTTTYSDTGRTASTSYSYRVRAQDAVPNHSSYSSIASATTPSVGDTQAPTVPSSLTATAASSTQINLSWTASTDNVAVTGYLVERCQGGGCSTFSQIATPTSTTYSDTGRTASTSYSYRVRARDAVPNYSGYSNTTTATTLAAPDTQAPTTPTALNITAAANQLVLTWTASTDNVAVTAYLIERCQGASCSIFAQIDSTTGTTYTDTAAIAGQSYSYRVRARDAVPNYSGYSTTGTATPADCD